jgi:hypothetical protein
MDRTGFQYAIVAGVTMALLLLPAWVVPAQDLDDESVERLSALGYVAGSDPAEGRFGVTIHESGAVTPRRRASAKIQNPTHQFTAAGTYTVSLTASNSNGSHTRVLPKLIRVPEPGVTLQLVVGIAALTAVHTRRRRKQ